MDRDSLQALLQHYFNEEVKEAWVFVGLGVLALSAGVWLWLHHSAFKHALWPLAALALVQIAVGAGVLNRSGAQVASLQAQLSADPAAYKDQEGQRVARTLDAFRFYKLAEIGLILAAMALALLGPQYAVARGWALGLLAQSALLLAADLVAEQRAEVYLDAIRRL